jgi:hypothetical protein
MHLPRPRSLRPEMSHDCFRFRQCAMVHQGASPPTWQLGTSPARLWPRPKRDQTKAQHEQGIIDSMYDSEGIKECDRSGDRMKRENARVKNI